MHDGVRSRPGERALNVFEPRDVTFMDTDAMLDCRQVSEARRLVREAVYLVASRHEMLGEMTARETGDAGDEHTEHGRIVPRMVRGCPDRFSLRSPRFVSRWLGVVHGSPGSSHSRARRRSRSPRCASSSPRL